MSERDAGVDPRGATLAAERDRAAEAVAATDHAQAGRRPPDAGDEGAEGRRLAGVRLAHFQLEERLGRGGMGEVYRATDLALDRPVAVKVLAREIAADHELRERFYREARTQARIQHPNVCHIYYIGEEDGLVFFAMEYIGGENLQERIDREGSVPADEAIELCRMAALGLREAHRHGFAHRDVKPSNLMVDAHGAVKVVDFGLVKQAEPSGGDVGITREGGSILGTPRYMAPEQARGDGVDFRTDIYALGATLHHLLAGAPPHDGDTPMAVVSKHLADARPPLPRRGRRGESVAFDELLDRMMHKRPDERFQSYDDLVAAMERLSPARSRPAGVFVRSFALALDFLFASMFVAAFSGLPIGMFAPSADWLNDLVLAAVALLYSVGGHARFGKTIGKAVLAIEVVPAQHSGPLGGRRAGIRFLAQWGPLYACSGLVAVAAALGAEQGVWTWLLPGLGAAGVLYALGAGVRALLSAHRLAVWDRVAGTRVVYAR